MIQNSSSRATLVSNKSCSRETRAIRYVRAWHLFTIAIPSKRKHILIAAPYVRMRYMSLLSHSARWPFDHSVATFRINHRTRQSLLRNARGFFTSRSFGRIPDRSTARDYRTNVEIAKRVPFLRAISPARFQERMLSRCSNERANARSRAHSRGDFSRNKKCRMSNGAIEF